MYGLSTNIDKKLTRSRDIRQQFGDKIIPCTKMLQDAIVLPKFSDNELLPYLLYQVVPTMENPDGEKYDANKFHIVFRVVDGKLLRFIEKNGRKHADVYAWDEATFVKKCKHPKPIGNGSDDGRAVLKEVADTIPDTNERKMFVDFFKIFAIDFVLAHTAEESRQCIVVTDELISQGLDYVINKWAEPNEKGEYPITKLVAGDLLIVEDEYFYCVEKSVAVDTYKW